MTSGSPEPATVAAPADASAHGGLSRIELLPGVGFVFVYLLWTNKNFYWDGVSFAILIEHAENWRQLFNVHHLLYNFIGYAAYKIAGGSVRALYLMQWINCVVGAALVIVMGRVLRKLGVAPTASVAWASVFGFAATFWKFTTDADSYILANLFLALAFLLLLPHRRPRPVLAAFAHFAALMMHQLAALFFPVALYCLWRQSRERFVRNAIVYSIITAGGTLAAYEWAFHLVPYPEAKTLVAWVTFHAKVPFFFNLGKSIGWLFLGTLRLIVGGKFREFELSPLGVIAGIAAVVALVAFVIAASRTEWRIVSIRPHAELPLWAGVYLAFLIVWEPYNTFYRLFYLLPLIAMAALAFREIPARTVTAFAAVLFTCNFALFTHPNSLAKNNAPLTFALDTRSKWPAGTGIIFSDFVPDLWTISYFTPEASWIPADAIQTAQVDWWRDRLSRDHKQLWLDWTSYERITKLPDGPAWIAAHIDESRSIHAHTKAGEFDFRLVK